MLRIFAYSFSNENNIHTFMTFIKLMKTINSKFKCTNQCDVFIYLKIKGIIHYYNYITVYKL